MRGPQRSDPSNQHLSPEFLGVLLEFVETAVHCILWVRGLYSQELFERRRSFSISVPKSRHPDVTAYIQGIIQNLKGILEVGCLRRVAVAIQNKEGQNIEKINIEFTALHLAPGSIDLDALQSHLAGVLLKLQFVDNLLGELPPGCTFSIVVYSSSRQGINQQFFVEEPAGSAQIQHSTATPVNSVILEGLLSLQVVLEEDELLKKR